MSDRDERYGEPERRRKGPAPRPEFPLPPAPAGTWVPLGEGGKYVCRACGVSSTTLADSRGTGPCEVCGRRTVGVPRDR